MRVLQCSIVLLMTSQVLFRGVTAFVTRGHDKAGATAPHGERGTSQKDRRLHLPHSKTYTEAQSNWNDVKTEEEQSKASKEDAIAAIRRDLEARHGEYMAIQSGGSAKCEGEVLKFDISP